MLAAKPIAASLSPLRTKSEDKARTYETAPTDYASEVIASRCLLALVSLPFCAAAQMLVDLTTKNGAEIAEYYRQTRQRKPELRCDIASSPPWMGFDFRMWTGYRIHMPARQFNGQASELAILFLVKPKVEGSREYLFFTGRFVVPAVPDPKKQEFYFEGGFELGPGEYEVGLAVVDRRDRVCVKDWSVKANFGKVDGGLEPNTVSAFRSNRWRGFPAGEARKGRVTVLLHAAPLTRRRFATKLSTVDRMILLNSLVSLLSRSRYAAARVVAFDIDGRRILFETEDFTPQAFRHLAGTLNKVEFGTIDINKLNHARPDKLLADLLEREHSTAQQSDRIVFLGPAHRIAGKMLAEVREVKLELPPTYYLTFSFLRMSPDDWIDRVVKKLANGKTIPIATPEDLSKAIAKVQN